MLSHDSLASCMDPLTLPHGIKIAQNCRCETLHSNERGIYLDLQMRAQTGLYILHPLTFWEILIAMRLLHGAVMHVNGQVR